MKAQCPQILDGKNRRGAGVALAKDMDLPNAGNELAKVLDNLVDAQPLVREILFLGEIIVQRFLEEPSIRIKDRIAVEHPLLFGDVVFAELARMLEHAFKKALVNTGEIERRKIESPLTQNLRDMARHLVSFFRIVLVRIIIRFGLVILGNQLLGFFYGNVAVNVLFGRLDQIIRRLEAVNRLQADSRLPGIAFGLFMRFALASVLIEIKILP